MTEGIGGLGLAKNKKGEITTLQSHQTTVSYAARDAFEVAGNISIYLCSLKFRFTT